MQPGIAPTTTPTAGTMFAALYGELTPHAWHDPDSEHDAYQLFHRRSLAMGWLEDRAVLTSGTTGGKRPVGGPGLWAMNDAGWSHPGAAPDAGLVSWFQVEAGAVPSERPLPVQPFLRCAQDTTARIGTVRLSAVQVLLPVQGIGPASRPPYAVVPSMRTTEWFGERDPAAKTPVDVAVNSGRAPTIPAVAHQLANALAELAQDVFTYGAHDVTERADTLPPLFHDTFWNGPPLHGMTLRGELAEWSCEAVGWLTETIADCAARLGVGSPLLVTVARSLPRT
ncbi:hypothetical protein R6V09_03160 [Streptomyces sp. W16]|uniref:hypothetical protein n=1 Tax=Streptomyces sp. W16 TaxID=3076631 RepID=UPI00295B59E0|nr:hypothetical protein [Streptomyces sp. W16]MDV9169136.1 hypothetical protein [Streptomyces sp. W16]